ncbi:MAG TPA: CCA tRNA nucleotidyltransferase [Candidatus Copromonas avistercoris]|nr:CCA tRNA nucleotidyltransferase [Candidatus Copromonas avistercoris]
MEIKVRIQLPYEVEWVIGKIRDAGYEAFAVGGCVRDTLLGRTPEDWDVTTSARPEAVKAIFERTVDTGLQHGTVTVLKNRKGYEVTTYRIDGEYHDGRHPDSVEFTPNLLEDLKRRDFTINAMAYSHETGIVDEFGGMEDLKAGIVRCVGRPEDRFTEDALRLLRALRFSAQLGFEIEESTYAAIKTIAPNLAKVSKERVQAELTKLLLSAHPERILLLKETGLSAQIVPGFDAVFAPALFSELSRLPAEKPLRWAGFLLCQSAKQAEAVLKGLKMDNETIGNVSRMIEGAKETLPLEKPAVRRAMSRYTPYQLEGALKLKELMGSPDVEEIRRLREEIIRDGDCVSLKEMAVKGRDLLEAGVERGPMVGEILNHLFDLVLLHPEKNDRELLLKEARRL